MQRQDIETFFKAEKTVAVGIPSVDWDRPYYFYGFITELTDEYLVIKHKNGFKKIRFAEIEDIHFMNGTNKRKGDR